MELLQQSAPPLPRAHEVGIVHQDGQILVIEKPPGMPCERRPEELDWTAQKRRRNLSVVEALETRGLAVWPVHRLDRETSGLMVYARSVEVQRALIHIFKNHQIQRSYLAVALGDVTAQTVHSTIVRDRGDGLRGSVDGASTDGKEAITHLAPIGTFDGPRDERYTLLRCDLETGRTHQIRIHLAEMEHPVCGERRYLSPRAGAQAITDPSKLTRHALHCALLGFVHPSTGEAMRFVSPWPKDLRIIAGRDVSSMFASAPLWRA